MRHARSSSVQHARHEQFELGLFAVRLALLLKKKCWGHKSNYLAMEIAGVCAGVGVRVAEGGKGGGHLLHFFFNTKLWSEEEEKRRGEGEKRRGSGAGRKKTSRKFLMSADDTAGALCSCSSRDRAMRS